MRLQFKGALNAVLLLIVALCFPMTGRAEADQVTQPVRVDRALAFSGRNDVVDVQAWTYEQPARRATAALLRDDLLPGAMPEAGVMWSMAAGPVWRARAEFVTVPMVGEALSRAKPDASVVLHAVPVDPRLHFKRAAAVFAGQSQRFDPLRIIAAAHTFGRERSDVRLCIVRHQSDGQWRELPVARLGAEPLSMLQRSLHDHGLAARFAVFRDAVVGVIARPAAELKQVSLRGANDERRLALATVLRDRIGRPRHWNDYQSI